MSTMPEIDVKTYQPQLIDLPTKDTNMTDLTPNKFSAVNSSVLASTAVERRKDHKTRDKIDRLKADLAKREDELKVANNCVNADKQMALAVTIAIIGSILIHYGLMYWSL